jgi:hypothetical protein
MWYLPKRLFDKEKAPPSELGENQEYAEFTFPSNPLLSPGSKKQRDRSCFQIQAEANKSHGHIGRHNRLIVVQQLSLMNNPSIATMQFSGQANQIRLFNFTNPLVMALGRMLLTFLARSVESFEKRSPWSCFLIQAATDSLFG